MNCKKDRHRGLGPSWSPCLLMIRQWLLGPRSDERELAAGGGYGCPGELAWILVNRL
jgi:hypothetical protein